MNTNGLCHSFKTLTSSCTYAISSPSLVRHRSSTHLGCQTQASSQFLQITLYSMSRAGRRDRTGSRSPLTPSVPPGWTAHVAQLLGAVGTCGRLSFPPNGANFNRGPTNTSSKQLPLLAGKEPFIFRRQARGRMW